MTQETYWVGIHIPRPEDLFEQALEKGWVVFEHHGTGFRASFAFNGLLFAGVGPSYDLALKALETHVRESDAGSVRGGRQVA